MKKTDANRPSGTPSAPLAIIGIGCLFPQAESKEAYWANITDGVDAISEIPQTHWQLKDYFSKDQKSPDRTYGHRGGFLSPVDFNPMEFNIPPNVLEAIDSSQLLGLVAAGQALKDAGYGPERSYDKSRASVILGVTGTLELVIPLGARLGHPIWRSALKDAGVSDAVAEDVVQRISESYVPWQENSFPGLLGNVVAGRVSKHFDLGGTNCVVDAACASSFSALHLAGMELASGKADIVVTGGIDTFNDIFMYMCFSKTPALSPSGDAKPFDSSADGTTLGEGLGIVVLKRLEDAERDGDRIYAVIRGVGSSSDGKGDAIYAPSAAGQKKALLDAYERAGVTPDTIGLIEAHGTGTRVGDGVEVNALREVYGETDQPWCALGSVKSQIGHTKAAAGAAGLIKAALALYHRTIPPTIKVQKPLPEVSAGRTPFYLPAAKRPWIASSTSPRRAAVSAFGFGGSNFHVVLEEYLGADPATAWDGDTQILAFSGSDASAISGALSTVPVDGAWGAVRAFAAASRARFDAFAPCRLTLVVERKGTDLATLVANAKALLAKQPATDWSTPDGAFFACGAPKGKVGILFPGQGSQYTGMLADLACRFPQLLDTLDAASEGFPALGALIYPPSPFDPQTRAQQEEALRATSAAQPAIGATSLGALKVLRSFGMEPDAVAGHSFGELTALCAAGCFDEEALHALSRLRGTLMGEGSGDKGGMLAVSAPVELVQDLLMREKLDLVIANRNAPTQSVLSGSTKEIDRAGEVFGKAGVTCKKLPVSAAFHSLLVADAAAPFLVALEKIAFQPAKVPVYANTTAALYPSEPGAAKALLAAQLAKPVQFVAQIEAMYAAGVRTFLEVGPGARLTGLVQSILGKRPHLALAVDASAGRRAGIADLARTIGQLAAHGYTVKLSRWDAGFVAPETGKKPLLTIPLSGANYVKPRAKREPVHPTVHAPAAPAAQAAVSAPAPAAPVATVAAAPAPSPVPQAQYVAAPAAPALQATREALSLLQKMQEETARLHRLFLEGQETAARNFQALLEQQQRFAIPSAQISSAVTYQAAPAPTVVAAPAVPVSLSVAPPPSAPPVQAPPVAAAPAPAPLAAPPAASDQTVKVLLEVVSEKTGYPIEMLELDMGMDADLGIDSIKRVEILSALHERLPGAPVIGPEHLGALNTLGEIAAHLSAGAPAAAAVSQAASAAPAPAVDNGAVTEALLSVVSEKTGYPSEMLELDMGLDSDLGIDSIKRVEILSALQERLPNAPTIGPEHLGTLHTLREIVGYLAGPGAAQAASTAVPAAAALSSVPAAPALPHAHVTDTLLSVVSEKTGYPTEMLALDMSLDADLGIDSIKRVEILSSLQERLPQAPAVGPEHLGVLSTLGEIADYLCAGASSAVQRSNPAAIAPVAAAAPTAPSASLDAAALAATLLSVVSEKTGYPSEMLALDMALDADLGIDSIKRVEILSTLQETLPGAPAIGPEHLGELRTLGDIVGHLSGGAAAPPVAAAESAAAAPEAPAEVEASPAVTEEVVPAPVFAADSVLPVERSSAVVVPLELTPAASSIATHGECWVTDDGSPFSAELCTALSATGLTVRHVNPNDAPPSAGAGELRTLVICAPAAGTDDHFLESAFLLLQNAAGALNQAAPHGGARCVTISRLDGSFGFAEGSTVVDPLSGGLAGLLKTAAREWPQVSCKAIDLGTFPDAAEAARGAAAEVLRDGPVEVGISAAGRVGLSLASLPPAPSATEPPLQEGDVVVITGGGRGVTAETAVALARSYKARLVLLGRTPEPLPEPVWLSSLREEAEMKRAIMANTPGKMHPREIEEKYRSVMAGRELRSTFSRIIAAGGSVLYRAVDIRDAAAVEATIAEIRTSHGPVRGVVHGAGVLADRLIVDKTREQFAQVYRTKVDGLRALLAATSEDDLRFIALFSSSTGRFGRIGQVDYAVANEVLNKLAQAEARRRPGCRCVSFNWGPWDGGMVSAPLKKVFASEGIGLIDLAAGGEFLVREVAAAGAPVEIVALATASPAVAKRPAKAESTLEEAFTLTLSVENYPFLRSHVMDGKAVLPMAVIAEWLAHGAMHRTPGLRLHGFNDLRICKGVTFDESTPFELQVLAGRSTKRDSFHLVPVELCSTGKNGRTVLHARAEIVLAARLPEGIRSITEMPATPYAPHGGLIYNPERLFHGPDLHGIEQVDGCSGTGIAAAVKGAPSPSQWIKQPLRSNWLTDPLVVDCAFQLMILWSFQRFGHASLPCFAGRYRQFQESFPKEGAQVVIRVTSESNRTACADIEFLDRSTGKLIARLEDYECVIDPALEKAFQRNRLTTAGSAQLGAA
ncbi:SDR family oxidoreductase [Geomonas sp. RF6]|uniref:type I polyketide synthase n=1 Tax=Geomonas sp. RF6 TaxID=2897342 RepID=UPI001E5F1EA2|nr:type I polyketide synthase [Geomonas sp. RF6]UFS70031.1 SDR family oxidoreductase [Geomonas sp. RF6]